eukprot:753231-Pyramimonas_sp.AAC.1
MAYVKSLMEGVLRVRPNAEETPPKGTWNLVENEDGCCWWYRPPGDVQPRSKVASFDIDGTLVDSKVVAASQSLVIVS